MTTVVVLLVSVLQIGVEGSQSVLTSDIDHVVDLPVDVANSSGRVEQTLHGVKEKIAGTEGHSHRLHCLHDGVDNVWGSLEDVGPNVVEEVVQCVFTAQTGHTQSQMLHCAGRRLAVYKVSVHQSVL